MPFVKRSMLACVLTTVLMSLLLTTPVAQAASAVSCPGWNLIASPNPHFSNHSVMRGTHGQISNVRDGFSQRDVSGTLSSLGLYQLGQTLLALSLRIGKRDVFQGSSLK